MPFVEHGQASIWYTDRGGGEALLLIHGGIFEPMDGARFWETPGVVPDLRVSGFRVLLPDRRYAGGSTSAPFEPYTWESDAADLAAVLRHAEVERVHVIAGSNGCSSAVRLALMRPQQIRSLLLCWPAAPNNASLEGHFELTAKQIEHVGPAAYLDELRERGIPRPGENRWGLPFGVALMRDERAAFSFVELPAARGAEIVRESGRALLAGEVLRGLDAEEAKRLGNEGFPVLIMPAEPENPVHPRAVAERLAAAVPGASLLPGFPEAPKPSFQSKREAFSQVLHKALPEG